jgi:Methyltransferase domain
VSATQAGGAKSPEPTFDDALGLLDGVQGWLTGAQARCLWEAARAVGSGGRIVEIGSFRGRSTIVLASGLRDGAELVAVDPHGGGDRGPQEIAPDAAAGDEDYAAFHSNLRSAGVQDRVNHVRAPSLDALDRVEGSVDLLYIDGAHRYAPARSDIERWGARVPLGGSMLIHDSFNAIGVMLAQLRVLLFSRRWRYIGRHGSLAIYRRAQLSAAEIAVNASHQLLGLPFFVRNMLIKIALVSRAVPVAHMLGHGDEPWPY